MNIVETQDENWLLYLSISTKWLKQTQDDNY